MIDAGCGCDKRCWVSSGMALIYLIIFPDDLEGLLAPVRVVLSLSDAIAPAAYGLLAVIVACIAWRYPCARGE